MRAKKGGEIGLNGETYKGGTFLPTTRLPKRGSTKGAARTGRQLVEPGVFAVPPPGLRSIFSTIRDVTVWCGGNLAPYFEGHRYWTSECAMDRKEVKVLCEKYNDGERFY